SDDERALWSLSFYVHYVFFSSRRRHTRCYRDWSSDVCSSDLWFRWVLAPLRATRATYYWTSGTIGGNRALGPARSARAAAATHRSEERRVGEGGGGLERGGTDVRATKNGAARYNAAVSNE